MSDLGLFLASVCLAAEIAIGVPLIVGALAKRRKRGGKVMIKKWKARKMEVRT